MPLQPGSAKRRRYGLSLPSPLRRNGAASWGGCGCPVDTRNSVGASACGSIRFDVTGALPSMIYESRVQTSPVSALCALPFSPAGSVVASALCAEVATGDPQPPRLRGGQGSFSFYESVILNPKLPCLPRRRGRCRRAANLPVWHSEKTRRRMRWNPTVAHRSRKSTTLPFAPSRSLIDATGAVFDVVFVAPISDRLRRVRAPGRRNADATGCPCPPRRRGGWQCAPRTDG